MLGLVFWIGVSVKVSGSPFQHPDRAIPEDVTKKSVFLFVEFDRTQQLTRWLKKTSTNAVCVEETKKCRCRRCSRIDQAMFLKSFLLPFDLIGKFLKSPISCLKLIILALLYQPDLDLWSKRLSLVLGVLGSSLSPSSINLFKNLSMIV